MTDSAKRERKFLPFDPVTPALVTSARLTTAGAHDRLRIWVRGGLAGELILSSGDGAQVAAVLGLIDSAPTEPEAFDAVRVFLGAEVQLLPATVPATVTVGPEGVWHCDLPAEKHEPGLPCPYCVRAYHPERQH